MHDGYELDSAHFGRVPALSVTSTVPRPNLPAFNVPDLFCDAALPANLPSLWCEPVSGLVPRVAGWIGERALHPARVVVLVPYAQLMRVGRDMWARCAAPGFTPRFETTRNWARGAGGFVPGSDDLAFDMARDLITAQSLLSRAGLAQQQVALAGRLVEIVHHLAPVVAAVPLPDRAGWAVQAMGISAGEGESPWFALETALVRIAVAWAATSGYATDVLLGDTALAQVDGLIVLEGLQADPLTRSLVTSFGERAMCLPLHAGISGAIHVGMESHIAGSDADVSADSSTSSGTVRVDEPSVQPGPFPPASLHEATDAEDEAERAAACVLQHIAQGRMPVALAAVDRAITRRIRARLDAFGVVIHDETGWKLSTTRSAATLMTALRACVRDVDGDRMLDWLKNSPAFPTQTVQRLEAQLRRRALRDWSTWRAIVATSDKPHDIALRPLTRDIESLRASLAGTRPLASWLKAVRALLQSSGQWAVLAADVAGAEVIDALHLDAEAAADLFDVAVVGSAPPRRIGLAEFTAWVRDVLEAANFVMAPPPDGAAQVIVLPVFQLIGRQFGAVVVPGCDDQRLPASPELPGGWGAEQRTTLGLPSRDDVALAQRTAWAVMLQNPHCDLLWRRVDASGEPVRCSPLVQLLELAGTAVPAIDPRPMRQVVTTPTQRPQPQGDALPVETLSASAYEDLRRCPYRFFGLRQLGLRDADELDAELGKRDFGNWLHAVLGHFHQALQESPAPELSARLVVIAAAAERATREMALSEAEFLPFAAAWPAVRDGYLDWLAAHEHREGAVFREAEASKEQRLGALRLIGRIDRIDTLPDDRAFVMDYKTESLKTSQDRVKDPTEDTQLAFYAALLDDDTLRAAYVNVGEKSSGTRTVEQQDVSDARDALIAGVLDDFQRIADGAALPALGEGMVCEHCAARGLCRKDFWELAA